MISITKSKAVGLKIAVAIISVAIAVALPQIFHLIGKSSGTGSVPGEIFLPMHISIFFAGLIGGVAAGAIAGALSPLISFSLTQMPSTVMLPFIMIELCAYGICCGIMRKNKMPTIVKVLIAQVLGRAIRAIAIIFAYYALSSVVKPAIILSTLRTGIPGIILQLCFVPLLMFYINSYNKKTGKNDDEQK